MLELADEHASCGLHKLAAVVSHRGKFRPRDLGLTDRVQRALSPSNSKGSNAMALGRLGSRLASREERGPRPSTPALLSTAANLLAAALMLWTVYGVGYRPVELSADGSRIARVNDVWATDRNVNLVPGSAVSAVTREPGGAISAVVVSEPGSGSRASIGVDTRDTATGAALPAMVITAAAMVTIVAMPMLGWTLLAIGAGILAGTATIAPPPVGSILLSLPLGSATLMAWGRGFLQPRHRGTILAAAIGAAAAVGTMLAVGRFGDPMRIASLGGTAVLVLFMLAAGMYPIAMTAWARATSTRKGFRTFLAALAEGSIPGRARSRAEGAASERARLGNELHGAILPAVVDVGARLRAIPGLTGEAEAIDALYGDLRSLIDDRQLVAVDVAGLVPAVETLAELIESRKGIEITVSIHESTSIERPPLEVERAAYRCCQLAIENAIRHGRCELIDVAVLASPNSVDVTVADNGIGFRPEDERRALRAGHLGIADMRQTAAAVGALLALSGRPEGGTTVQFAWNG